MLYIAALAVAAVGNLIIVIVIVDHSGHTSYRRASLAEKVARDRERAQFVDVALHVQLAMRPDGRHDRALRVHNYTTGVEEPWPTTLADAAVASVWPRHKVPLGPAEMDERSSGWAVSASQLRRGTRGWGRGKNYVSR